MTSATTPGPAFIDVEDRIATFDNDGTLWVEQPLPPQFGFVFGHWAEEIKADPSLAGRSQRAVTAFGKSEVDDSSFNHERLLNPDVPPQELGTSEHNARGVNLIRLGSAYLAPMATMKTTPLGGV